MDYLKPSNKMKTIESVSGELTYPGCTNQKVKIGTKIKDVKN